MDKKHLIIIGLCSIVDGIIVVLTLGYKKSNLALKYALYFAQKEVKRKRNQC